RTWTSEPGASLLFSVVLRPDAAPDRTGLLTLAAGAAMAEACRAEAGVDVRCKWPNDLLLDERKAGGILAESRVVDGRIRFVVVGVGLNLRAPGDHPEAAGIGDVEPAPVLRSFLRSLRRPSGDLSQVPAVYRRLSATIGRRVKATTTEGRATEGLAVDVDEQGNLVLDVGGRRETVSS